MKKAILAGLLGFSVLFVACGPKNTEDADKKKADSIHAADSTAKAAAAADSVANAAKATAAADSAVAAAKADSIAKATPAKKTK